MTENHNFRQTWKDSAISAYKAFCSQTGFEGMRKTTTDTYVLIY